MTFLGTRQQLCFGIRLLLRFTHELHTSLSPAFSNLAELAAGPALITLRSAQDLVVLATPPY